ncbi:MAG: AraC family transcriptional regulator [Thomasclavelia sp.]|nr:AraC family transcriptional regulator [Thomasclavelia sp.]
MGKYKYERIIDDDNLPTKLHYFNYKNNNTIHRVELHWHRSVEIIVPIKGTSILWLSGEEIELNSERVYIVNSCEFHSVTLRDTDVVYEGYAIQINYEYLKSCFSDIDNISFNQPSKNVSKLLKEKVLSIASMYKKGNTFDHIKLLSYIQMLVFLLFDNLSTTRIKELKDYTKVQGTIIDVVRYLENNYQDDIVISRLALKFNISEGYLARQFKYYLGLTIKEYLINVRLSAATKQVLNTNDKLFDIAINNGFPNIQSFNIHFKRKYNVTPTKYREMSKNHKCLVKK